MRERVDQRASKPPREYPDSRIRQFQRVLGSRRLTDFDCRTLAHEASTNTSAAHQTSPSTSRHHMPEKFSRISPKHIFL